MPATRLKKLQAAGVIHQVPRSRIVIYELTPYGRELEPVVLALGAWGFRTLGTREEQVISSESMTMDLRSAFRVEVAAALPATAYSARVGGAELLIRVSGPSLDVGPGSGVVDLAFSAGPGIRRLIRGERSADRAVATGVAQLLGGSSDLLDRFPSRFHLAA